MIRRNRKRTRVLVIREDENELGLVKSTIFLIISAKMAFVIVEIRAAAI